MFPTLEQIKSWADIHFTPSPSKTGDAAIFSSNDEKNEFIKLLESQRDNIELKDNGRVFVSVTNHDALPNLTACKSYFSGKKFRIALNKDAKKKKSTSSTAPTPQVKSDDSTAKKAKTADVKAVKRRYVAVFPIHCFLLSLPLWRFLTNIFKGFLFASHHAFFPQKFRF